MKKRESNIIEKSHATHSVSALIMIGIGISQLLLVSLLFIDHINAIPALISGGIILLLGIIIALICRVKRMRHQKT